MSGETRAMNSQPTREAKPESSSDTLSAGVGEQASGNLPLTRAPLPSPPPRLDEYEAIIGTSQLDELRFLATGLRGKTVKMVNSTAVGGGVAEMLNAVIPLLNELEIATKWE